MHSVGEAYNSCRVTAEDYGVMGLRYGSGKLSAGVTIMPYASMCSGFIVNKFPAFQLLTVSAKFPYVMGFLHITFLVLNNNI